MHRSSSRTGIAIVAAIAIIIAASAPAHPQTPFRLVANRPFDAVTTGPMGAIVVDLDDVQGPLTKRNCDIALQRAIAEQHSPESLAGARSMVEYLRKKGLLGRRFFPRFPRAAVFVRNGRMLMDTSTGAAPTRLAAPRQLGGGDIDIIFEASSFDLPVERQAIIGIFNDATPIIDAIYGQPAETITVQIEEMPAGSAPEQGGVYIPGVPNARLRLGRFLDVPELDPGNLFAFLVLLVRAYHNTAMIDFDAWEEGFARFVATLVWESIRPTVPIDDANGFLAVPRYDAMNLPALGTPTFFQPVFSGMLLPRISMAVTAWGKVYYEDPGFFRNFNAAYYAAFNSSLPGDSAALRTIAASVISEVEGVSFHDWFRRQHILDTSASPGETFYPWYIAFHEGDQPDEYGAGFFFLHYFTDLQGDETPLGGTVELRYTNHDRSVDIFVQEGFEAFIPGSGATAGQGQLAPTFFPQNTGTGGQEGNGGRLSIDMRLGGFFMSMPFPYTGPGPAPTNPRGPFDIDFWGVVMPANDGDVRVTPPSGPAVTLPVDEGMFRGRVSPSGVLDPGAYMLEYIPPGATDPTVTTYVNVVDIRQNVILHANSVASPLLSVQARLSLISLPLIPLVGGQAPADPADVFGISQDQLLMARWQPDDPGVTKYRFYPRIPPIEPGMGFFLKPPSAIVDLPITGIPPDPTKPYVMHLMPGWNNIGFPFNSTTPIQVSQLLIAEGDPGIDLNQGIPLSQAASQGLVEGSIFDFVAGRDVESDVVTQLERFKGYWMRCLRVDGVQLIFQPAGAGTLARGRSVVPGPTPDWELPIRVTTNGRSAVARMAASSEATDGFDGAHDAHMPPPPPGGGIRSYFVPEDGGEPLFRDVRGTGASESAWRLEVDPGGADSEVEIHWPDLTQLPRDLRPELVDGEAGRRCAMRTVRTYRFRSGASGTPRRFTITTPRGSEGALQVTGLTSSIGRGGRSMTVHFGLTRSAATTVAVYNVAGRLVRRVTRAEALPRGLNSIEWDLRADSGTAVPSGTYLCHVQTRSEDGQSAGGVTTIHVPR